jgi:Ca2+-binding EF-hand superfamily protein
MEISKSLELHLTEAELETLINAVRRTSDGRFAELEFKLRAAWRRALQRSDYSSITPDVG